MSFQFNNTSVYNILNSTGYICTEDTYTTYIYFSKWIFTSQSPVLMFLHALHMNTPYLLTLRASTDSVLSSTRATNGWWFGVQGGRVLAGKENKCVIVNPKNFLPKFSKMLLFSVKQKEGWLSMQIHGWLGWVVETYIAVVMYLQLNWS